MAEVCSLLVYYIYLLHPTLSLELNGASWYGALQCMADALNRGVRLERGSAVNLLVPLILPTACVAEYRDGIGCE